MTQLVSPSYDTRHWHGHWVDGWKKICQFNVKNTHIPTHTYLRGKGDRRKTKRGPARLNEEHETLFCNSFKNVEKESGRSRKVNRRAGAFCLMRELRNNPFQLSPIFILILGGGWRSWLSSRMRMRRRAAYRDFHFESLSNSTLHVPQN